jgi:hypothetical protein
LDYQEVADFINNSVATAKTEDTTSSSSEVGGHVA